MKRFKLITILALVYVLLSVITASAEVVFVGLNAGVEMAIGSDASDVDDQGLLLGGTVKYFSETPIGVGFSLFKGSHDADSYYGDEQNIITNYSLDLMLRLSDSSDLLPYALISLGSLDSEVGSYSSDTELVVGFGVGALMLPENSTGFTFGGELRYVSLPDDWNADGFLLALLNVGYSFGTNSY